jgi:hypothetical protein
MPPLTTSAQATMASYCPLRASDCASSGISNAPGTSKWLTRSAGTPRAAQVATAASRAWWTMSACQSAQISAMRGDAVEGTEEEVSVI